MALTDWYCDEVLTGTLKVDPIFEDERVLAATRIIGWLRVSSRRASDSEPPR